MTVPDIFVFSNPKVLKMFNIMKKFFVNAVVLFLFIILSANLCAKTILPGVIGNGMVLKQKSEVAFWGWDDPGTDIFVQTSWNGKKYAAKAGSDGKWNMSISTPRAGGPYHILINGMDRIELNNVLIGEVWLTSGQSNMGWSVTEEKNAENILKNADHANIRLFHVPRHVSDRKESVFGKNAVWKECNAETVRNFSAMSYHFAVFLQEQLNVPIGIISASWAGTGIESWLSYDLQASDDNLKKAIGRWWKWEKDFPHDSIAYAEKLALREENLAKGIAQEIVKKPKSVHMLQRPHCKPGSLYNGMVHPCMPYTISGLIWYQGENSVEWADEYEYQLQSLIDSWRAGFYSDFPVLVGQLTNFNYPSAERAAIVRDAQLKAREKKDTYVICTIDIGNADDVHPDDKLPFGRRFADMALNKIYGRKNFADYPVAKKAVAKGDRIIVSFDLVKKLCIKGKELNDIWVTDATGTKQKARAFTKKNKLIICCENIQNPVKVSYAVENNVNANLYSKNGLPAFPFTLPVRISEK